MECISTYPHSQPNSDDRHHKVFGDMESDPGSPVKKPTRDAILTIAPSVTKKILKFMREITDQSAISIYITVGFVIS